MLNPVLGCQAGILRSNSVLQVMFAIREAEDREKQSRKGATKIRSITEEVQDVYLNRSLREETFKRL